MTKWPMVNSEEWHFMVCSDTSDGFGAGGGEEEGGGMFYNSDEMTKNANNHKKQVRNTQTDDFRRKFFVIWAFTLCNRIEKWRERERCVFRRYLVIAHCDAEAGTATKLRRGRCRLWSARHWRRFLYTNGRFWSIGKHFEIRLWPKSIP